MPVPQACYPWHPDQAVERTTTPAGSSTHSRPRCGGSMLPVLPGKVLLGPALLCLYGPTIRNARRERAQVHREPHGMLLQPGARIRPQAWRPEAGKDHLVQDMVDVLTSFCARRCLHLGLIDDNKFAPASRECCLDILRTKSSKPVAEHYGDRLHRRIG